MRSRHAGRSARATRLVLLQFLHGAVCLIDGAVGIGVGSGVGVSDRESPERLARRLAWGLAAFQPELIEQRIVFVGVSVRPAVDGDFQNVARGIESAGTE